MDKEKICNEAKEVREKYGLIGTDVDQPINAKENAIKVLERSSLNMDGEPVSGTIIKEGKDITIYVDAATATDLATSRLISVNGDGNGSTSFDETITLILANTGVSVGTSTKVTVDSKGRTTAATNLAASDIPGLTLSKITDVGTVASKNTETSAGNIPILDANGKLDTSVLPALAISDTFVVASQTAMLALAAEIGDVAIRTDLNKSFILKTTGASTLDNWQELLSPTSAVQSVAGKTGIVTLNSSDVGLGNVTNESKATMFTSPSFTGTPTAPTPVTTDNSTKIATTAFVKAQGFITTSDTIDGGTF